jgi:hypothetical protein
MNDKEGDEQKLSPAAEEAMAKLVEIFIRAFPRKRDSVAPLKGRTISMSYSSRLLMTNSAMIHKANTNNGSGDFMTWGSFLDCRMNGNRWSPSGRL